MSSDPTAVAALIRNQPRESLIALDVDGTLAPIVSRPEDAAALPGTIEVLRSLRERGIALALLTGRPAAEAVRIVGLTQDDDIPVFGQYGLQRWIRGEMSSPPPSAEVAEVRAKLPQLLADAPDGVHVEDKGLALVVHARPAADPAAAIAMLLPRLRELAERLGLELLGGRSVIEIRPRGTDKGGALLTFAGAARWSVAVFAGDDLGDLPAYAALGTLAGLGTTTMGIAVVDAAGDTDQAVTRAGDVTFHGPTAVLAWLRSLS